MYATCNIGDEALNVLRDRGYELEVYPHRDPPPKSLILEKVSSGIDGLITTLRDPIDSEVFQAGAGTLQVVAQDAVGFDNIDRPAANHYRIPFTNTADVLTNATAEFALFLLGAVSRKLYTSERIVRDHQWETWHPFLPVLGTEVSGKTVTIVGAGRIGRAFALKCLGLGVDLLFCDSQRDEQFLAALRDAAAAIFECGINRQRQRIEYVSLEEGLASGDFVSLHVPLTDETRHLINSRTLSLMRPSAFLINTSRGPVVDEEALHEALIERRIAGAALDVFEREPLPAESPLRDSELADRLRLFHHFASGTEETRLSTDPNIGMAGRCVQGLIDVLEDNYGGDLKAMPFVVNKEAF